MPAMPKSFDHRFVVTIGDTNMEQNVYWVNFCKWFGHTRELFLMSLLPDRNIRDFLKERRVALVTCEISMKFLKPAFFADPIIASLRTDRWGRCSCDLLIEFRAENGGHLLATGRQKVAFMNADTQRFMPVPDEIRRPAEAYAVEKPERQSV